MRALRRHLRLLAAARHERAVGGGGGGTGSGTAGGGAARPAAAALPPQALGAGAGAAGLAVLAACSSSSRPGPPAGCAEAAPEGSRVLVWGQRFAVPACEAAGDAAPEADLRVPTEIAWFRQHAETHKCRWRQLAFGPSFGAARTDTGELFAWGSCKGRDGGRTFLEPRPLVFDELGSAARFRDVQCSESALWAITTEGEVIVWERVPNMISERACASQSSAEAAKNSGYLAGGKRVSGMDRPVRDMSVGASHAAFLTDIGECYCLGSNRCGECGADPAVQGMAAACRVVRFPRHVNPVARVRCGRSHTVVIGAEGQVLAWGDDSKIQLGLGDTRSNTGDERPWQGARGYQNFLQTGESMAPPSALRGFASSPSFSKARSTSSARYGEFQAHAQWQPCLMQEIPLEFDRQVHGTPYPPPDGIVCGDDFTILLVRDSPDWFPPEEESNRLFCCGENGKGQCGRSLQASQQTMAAAKLPRNSYSSSVSCGANHCLAVLQRIPRKKRELWCWGSNERGQAGAASTAVVCPATRLRLPRGLQVEAAWCGFATSAAICTERRPQGIAKGAEATAEAAGQAAAGGKRQKQNGDGDSEEDEE